ncbi:MAG: hypothetical protein Kow00120_13290 [Anaerolineae bacterium]
MVNLVFIIQRSANAVYIIAGAGLLFWGWRLLRAQRRLAQTQFELEREYALSERARYFNLTALCVLIILGTIAIAHVVAPYLRAHPLSFTQADPLVFNDQFVTRAPGAATQPVALAIGVTPPPGELAAPEMEAGGDAMDAMEAGPTPLPLGGMATDIFSGEVEATYTPSPTPPGTIIPDAPSPMGCTDPGAVLTLPKNGQVLFEAIVVEGSANVPGFSAYKFEIKGPSTNNAWSVLRTYTNPVDAGVLGQFDGSAFSPGTYQFRLAVVDTGDATIASCTITIVISEPIPTPTRIRPND